MSIKTSLPLILLTIVLNDVAPLQLQGSLDINGASTEKGASQFTLGTWNERSVNQGRLNSIT